MSLGSTTYIILWIVVLFLLLFSAFFSAAETAYSSVRKSKILVEIKKGASVAKLINKQTKSFGLTLSTILVLNNMVNIAMSTFTALLLSFSFETGTTNVFISTALITPIIVVFGEIIPKLLAKKYSYGYLKIVSRIFKILNYLFFPITYPLSKFHVSNNITNTEMELHSLLDVAKKEGVLEKNEASLAANALKLDSIIVEEIFIHKKNIVSININDSREVILKVFKETGFSRLPILKNNKFIGIILFKDFIYSQNSKIEELIINVPIVSKNKLVNLALEKMRQKKTHFAFVAPRENSKEIIGLVTIEDIIEELIGEVYDEHDKTSPIREIGLYNFVAIGSVKMKLVKNVTKIDFDDIEKEQTLKQWISKRINRKIKKDLKYTYKNKIQFKIISNKNNDETIIEIKIK